MANGKWRMANGKNSALCHEAFEPSYEKMECKQVLQTVLVEGVQELEIAPIHETTGWHGCLALTRQTPYGITW